MVTSAAPSPLPGDERLDLRTAAERLGVHYQTAYRWVRTGDLPAVKEGGSYRVRAADIERLAARRARPAPPPRTVRVRDWDEQVTRFHDLILAGDERAAWRLAERLRDGAMGMVELCEHLVAPAMRRIGEEWSVGAVTVAEEHLASGICERLLARATPSVTGPQRGVALVATLPGDDHHLPAAMATVVLREDRWKVHHLGTSVPIDTLVDMALARGANLVVLSCTGAGSISAAGGVKTILGGMGIATLAGAPGATLTDLVHGARATIAQRSR